jgi:hypothetical protein
MTVPPPDQLIPQPKILLEGTSLTRKTDTAFVLAEHPRIIGDRKHRWHIPLVSSEWETRSDVQPTKGAPGSSMITFAPHEEAWAMELFHTYVRLFELNADYYWIVDRFHISTIHHQAAVNDRHYDLSWVDDRLAALNFRLVLLSRRRESFEAARAERLTYSENPWRYTDLDRLDREQDRLRELVAASSIPSIEVDVTDRTVAGTADHIIDWVERTGAMYRPPARPATPVYAGTAAGPGGLEIPPR